MHFQFSMASQPLINPGERHLACVLLVDTSASMSGAPISELNKALVEFGDALKNDYLAQRCAEACIISFNSSVQTEMGFRPAADYEAPILSASGLTSMNEAVEAGLDALEARKADYRANGVSYYRPWLILLTDGASSDIDLESSAKTRLQNAIKSKKVVFLPMGIGDNANIAQLQSYYPADATVRPVFNAKSSAIKEAFAWFGCGYVRTCGTPAPGNVQLAPAPSCISVEV